MIFSGRRFSHLILRRMKRIRIGELSEGEAGNREDTHTPSEMVARGDLKDQHVQQR